MCILKKITRAVVAGIKMGKIDKRCILLLTFFPLVIGAVFYYVLCPDLYFVVWIDKVTRLCMHAPSSVSNNGIIVFIRCYLMDFVWAYAFANAICFICQKETKLAWFMVGIPLACGAFLEFLQGIGYISGTCDIFDVFAETAGGVLAYVFIRKMMGGRNHEKR